MPIAEIPGDFPLRSEGNDGFPFSLRLGLERTCERTLTLPRESPSGVHRENSRAVLGREAIDDEVGSFVRPLDFVFSHTYCPEYCLFDQQLMSYGRDDQALDDRRRLSPSCRCMTAGEQRPDDDRGT